MASRTARKAATKMRTLAKYLRRHPELEQVYGHLGRYPRVCVLGAMAEAHGDRDGGWYFDYPLDDAPFIQDELIAANDEDYTDFDTFIHFVESCDYNTLADMLDALNVPDDED